MWLRGAYNEEYLIRFQVGRVVDYRPRNWFTSHGITNCHKVFVRSGINTVFACFNPFTLKSA